MHDFWARNSGTKLSANQAPKWNHTPGTFAPKPMPGWHLKVQATHLDKPLSVTHEIPILKFGLSVNRTFLWKRYGIKIKIHIPSTDFRTSPIHRSRHMKRNKEESSSLSNCIVRLYGKELKWLGQNWTILYNIVTTN